MEKELQHFQELLIPDNDSKNKRDSSVAEGVESGEILSSSSEWNLGSDRDLFVTRLNHNSGKTEELIKFTLIFLLILV